LSLRHPVTAQLRNCWFSVNSPIIFSNFVCGGGKYSVPKSATAQLRETLGNILKSGVKSQPLYKINNIMTSADNIRNSIIDKLLTISNKDYLSALHQLVSTSKVNDDVIQLSEAQILMLNMSEDDINNDRIISQEDLDKLDLEWLKAL